MCWGGGGRTPETGADQLSREYDCRHGSLVKEKCDRNLVLFVTELSGYCGELTVRGVARWVLFPDVLAFKTERLDLG